jgi:bifunctional UDP-N-acetylglucosamine pyrophosphorylase/glucosamine-1-phosphate N-acetyltransferase
MTDIAIIVLAAGLGTRMKSAVPKVLHKAAGRSLLAHVLHSARGLAPSRAVVVAGPGMDEVAVEAQAVIPGAAIAVQAERRGTADAVACARQALAGFAGTVLVLYGDVPLIQGETLVALCDAVDTADPVAVVAFEAADPHGYGRIVRDAEGNIAAICEEADASPEERNITLCNSGIIAISAEVLWRLLPGIGSANAKGEFYLTDLIGLAASEGIRVGLVVCGEGEVAGVNDRIQLAAIEATLQERYRAAHMQNGVTLVAPESVFFTADTVLGQDVVIGPHVVFGPGVSVGDGVEILGFSHIEGATIAAGSRIGPFARLRPGAEIGEEAHIGNFVEVKKSRIGKGAKVNHLSYIGDAKIGAATNIGAGTITCNYDGFAKHETDIGAGVFVGSNTALVAPVKVGEGAAIAAGTVVTRDVPAEALAIGRPELKFRPGWAARNRSAKKAAKPKKESH